MTDREGRPITSVRPAAYDLEEYFAPLGKVQHDVPEDLLDMEAADVRRLRYLVEDELDLLSFPYTLLISVANARGSRAWYQAATEDVDLSVAADLAERFPELFPEEELWSTLATWQALGFEPEDVAAWAELSIMPAYMARTYADLGWNPLMLLRHPAWRRRPPDDDAFHGRVARKLDELPNGLVAPIEYALLQLNLRTPWPSKIDVDAPAVVLVLRLLSENPKVASAGARDIVRLLWAPLSITGLGFEVPRTWWRTELGEECAKALGGATWPPGDPDLMTVMEVMELLDLPRPQIHELLDAGKIARTDGGWISRKSLAGV